MISMLTNLQQYSSIAFRILFFLGISFNWLIADTLGAENDTIQNKINLAYGSKGFQAATSDGLNLLQVEFRGQFRVAYPFNTNPITFDDYENEAIYMGVNRARIKIGGHAYRMWLKYYTEYELFSAVLLNFELKIEKYSWLSVNIGQYKIAYNRERLISSGKQQTVERSILTQPFTVDRQQGITLYGNLDAGFLNSFNYWLGVYLGTGRGNKTNDDNHPMYMGRLQWNFAGESPLKFSGSDLKIHDRLTGILAFAVVTNQSPYTRFSTSGGGNLDMYPDGQPGQFKVNQWLQESAFKYKGFSWQQEYHWKQIVDNLNSTTRQLNGYLLQGGYFFNQLWEFVPPQLEIFGRYANYIPDLNFKDTYDNEYTLGANWYMNGHRNKFTADISYLNIHDQVSGYNDVFRYRIQWDISF